MKTEYYDGCTGNAAKIIREGGVVAVPTETVYGLAGNGLNPEAVSKIYEIKGRPEIKPLALMVSGKEEIQKFCTDVPEQAILLAERFWPGPLSIVLKARKDIVPEIVRAGGDTVSLRCPASPLTLKALKEAQVPFAAPSANPSGAKSPKSAQEVAAYFDGKINAVIDGGECSLGIESTIINLSSEPYKILRKGALAEDEIKNALLDGLDIIGITGPSGSGKSTALAQLEKSGALVIDCDLLYHTLLNENSELLSELNARFPGVIAENCLDRKMLGKIVFSDADALSDLNRITHKYIIAETKRLMKDFAMNGGKTVALDAVELISSGMGEICRIVVGVTAPADIRVMRIMHRDGITEKEALLRINAQRPDSYYRENCTVVLENGENKEEFIDLFMETVRKES